MEPGQLVGKTLAGCRLVASIGGGSSGEVFRGVHEGLQRPVAVKIVRVDGQDRESADGLLAEARSLAKTEHPNIVHVYDVGLQGNLFYIVMQFLEGTNLKTRFDESGAFSAEEASSVIEGVARGLGAMHRAGLIHRDLKLENVMVTPEGNPIIMDFGLVRDSGGRDEYQGQVVGTAAYIAPEIWSGRPADARSDLYSLGVMLYALVAGEYPFRARTPQEYRALHLGQAPKAPSRARPGVSEELSAVTLKLLARPRDRRYASVEEFLKDLEACRQGTDPQALESTGRKIRCGFCESVMPAKAQKCSVCGEALHSPKEIELKTGAGDLPCPSCGQSRERRVRSCPHCGKGICINCLRGAVVREGLCAKCIAIV